MISACAQVSKQSVELSATVGRDVSEMHRAHRELGILYFDRIIADINRFVDDVYAPYQIEETLKVYQSVLAEAILKASESDPTGEAQRKAYGLLKVYVEELHKEVEDYREELVKPVRTEKNVFLARVDASYQQIHYANSIVTGHLSSIVKVHETQDKLLAEAGLEGLRKDVGEKVSKLSERVADIVEQAQKGEEKIGEAAEKLKELIEQYEKMKDTITGN
jgi:F0F1-type ATP synthase membrane subunit b/b'